MSDPLRIPSQALPATSFPPVGRRTGSRLRGILVIAGRVPSEYTVSLAAPYRYLRFDPISAELSAPIPAQIRHVGVPFTMAFQHPTRQTMQRAARQTSGEQEVPGSSARSPQEQQQQQPEEAQTWVLFSPPTEVTTASYLTETERSLETPGRSRLSDLGSFDSALRTAPASAVQPVDGEQSASLSIIGDESVGDDAELDSLDSHLPGFRSLPGQDSAQHGQPVLPAHDGLGSFRLDRPTLGTEAQEQIYQFEKFNPKRVRRRLDSFDQAQIELEQTHFQEKEKRQRIEAWRLEHSRILLDEVQRETRRRQKSQASLHRLSKPAESESDLLAWHDQEAEPQEDETEGFIARVTCKVVRDLLGIDDRLLSILMGETLPNEDELSSTPRASHMCNRPELLKHEEKSWHLDILEKLSTELGLLVNQLSKHPGAFSTYARIQQAPLPYAGLPVIPESGDQESAVHDIATQQQLGDTATPEFKPTICQSPHAVNIARHGPQESDNPSQEDVVMGNNAFTQQEWEQELDIKLVFKYLVSRLTSKPPNPSPSSPNASHHGSIPTQDIAAKAARVRQHHPLISRARPTERRTFKATLPTSPAALRHHSSCASQSTRRSARRSSCSSRHYWDIGGSLGTGSMIASNGPMGSWGEV